MPLYAYNRDIPDGPNNPSDDQPDMQQNTNSIDDLIDEDHYAFNDANGGLHKQQRMVAGSLPAGRAVGLGTIYAKSVTRSAVTSTEAFFVPDNTSDEYQLTQTITASYALFALNTNNYNGVGTTFTGGWKFAAGALIEQYGRFLTATANNLPGSGTVTFPVVYSSAPFNVQISPTGTSGSGQTIQVTTVSTTGFTWTFTGGSSNSYSGFYWTAIGK